MNKKFIVRLSVEERSQLEALVAKGKAAARKLTRARILLKADCSSLGPAWSDQEHQLDVTVMHVLKQLFRGRRLIEKSLTQWMSERDQVLRDAPPNETLSLVDQDFSDEGGASDGGIHIIKDLQERFRDSPLFCGLLSHTFTPHEEHENHDVFSVAAARGQPLFLVFRMTGFRAHQGRLRGVWAAARGLGGCAGQPLFSDDWVPGTPCLTRAWLPMRVREWSVPSSATQAGRR